MGIKSLAAALPFSLAELDVGNNDIGDEGIMSLAAKLPPQLRKLELESKYCPSIVASLFLVLDKLTHQGQVWATEAAKP